MPYVITDKGREAFKKSQEKMKRLLTPEEYERLQEISRKICEELKVGS